MMLFYGPDANGTEIVSVLPHGNKVFNLHRDLPICAMTCGAAGNSRLHRHDRDICFVPLAGLSLEVRNVLPSVVFSEQFFEFCNCLLRRK